MCTVVMQIYVHHVHEYYMCVQYFMYSLPCNVGQPNLCSLSYCIVYSYQLSVCWNVPTTDLYSNSWKTKAWYAIHCYWLKEEDYLIIWYYKMYVHYTLDVCLLHILSLIELIIYTVFFSESFIKCVPHTEPSSGYVSWEGVCK